MWISLLNDDEIVTSVQEEFNPVDDETDEDEDNNKNGSSKDPSNTDARQLRNGTNSNQSIVLLKLQLLKRIRDLAAKKRRCTMIQRNLSDYFPQLR
ncbi:hypothetical protein TNCV_3581691 [Trichonephila clavipes]|nr:hypothetical protein TNCV_3581691 [Trichonephila clavipes]